MLSVQNVSFGYKTKFGLSAISFELKEGKTLAVVGESGSGKSTLLKLIYGEYDVDEGLILWKNKKILGPKDKLVVGHDFIKYVSQEFDLMPFTTVAENVGFHLSNFYPEHKEQRVKELLEVVNLESYANQKVKFLSGGQKQSVALAKALANQPEIILLDEPFSHIDSFKKRVLRRSLFKFLKSNNIACVIATHDQNDVLSFADKMVVLHNGQVVSKDTPERLYNDRKNPIVAAFFSEYSTIDGQIYYAHQIRVCKKDGQKVTVVRSYFKGYYFLVEALYKKGKIFFNHNSFLVSESEVFVSLEGL